MKKGRAHAHLRALTCEVGRRPSRFAGWAQIIGSLVV